jgi:hypothetical protein
VRGSFNDDNIHNLMCFPNFRPRHRINSPPIPDSNKAAQLLVARSLTTLIDCNLDDRATPHFRQLPQASILSTYR